jgi:hypothetical protein
LYHISPAICTLTQIGIYTNARDRTSQNIRTLGEWWQDAVPKVSIVVAFGKNMKILKLDLEDIVSGTIPETYQMAKPKDQKATKKAVVKILKRISRHTSQVRFIFRYTLNTNSDLLLASRKTIPAES